MIIEFYQCRDKSKTFLKENYFKQLSIKKNDCKGHLKFIKLKIYNIAIF